MLEQRRIRLLDPAVADKIAAGEVIERPASVVKELMENAADAGASRIDVDISAGGRTLVRVADNGCGMSREDAALCTARHATSKICRADDIDRIATLGFRGEALAVISAVSRLRLTTRTADGAEGTEILVTGGKSGEPQPIGCPAGTCVEVRDLFFNIPARKKFLRSERTELGHVRAAFIVQALALSGTAMSLKVDGRETHTLVRSNTDIERIGDLFGSDYCEKLTGIRMTAGDVTVHGFVSVPPAGRSDRSEQYIFVNGRPAGAAVVGYAIREAYRTLLPDNRFPAIFLFIEIDPGQVDVNVHPAKREVRFRHGMAVRDTIISAIRGELGRSAAVRGLAGPGMPAAGAERHPADNLVFGERFGYPRSMPAGREYRPVQETGAGRAGQEQNVPRPDRNDTGSPDKPWAWCRVVGRIGSLYVALETEDGFILMDPHAAHERVLYDRFMAELPAGKVESQNLLMPQTVELPAASAVLVRKNMAALGKMGFSVADFGGDTFVIDALPAHFAGAEAGDILTETARALEEAGTRGAKERAVEEIVAMAACRAAVKARDKLGVREIEKLVDDLARTEMPYTCPHGRPTMIFTSFKDLDRKFGRE